MKLLWIVAVFVVVQAEDLYGPTLQCLQSGCETLPTETKTLLTPQKRFLGFIGKALGIVGSVFGIVQKTRANHQTAEAFKQVFGGLDRNLQAITNVQEHIDVMMSKSLDAIGNLDHKLDQSTAEIIADINEVSSKVDRNYGYLLKVFQEIDKTYTAVERSRLEMHDEFLKMADILKTSKIQATITKLNNFLGYFVDEKARISQLSRQERVATLLDSNGFLQNLRESRTPRGDSLQTFLYEMTSQGYVIPKLANDSVAFAALNSLYYGVQTHVSVVWYLMKVNVYLADNAYRSRDIEKFNDHMEHVLTDFHGFSTYLVGGTGSTGLIDQTIAIYDKVANLKFIASTGENSSSQMLDKIKALKEAKQQLTHATMPLLMEIPDKLETQVKFDNTSLKTPLGFWNDGARVKYAIQYRQDNLYSRVGEWSEPFVVQGKANPRLRIPAHSTYARLIFRRFNDETPQYVGMLDRGSESDFWDIDRDLYNAAMGTDEAIAVAEAVTLIGHGAKVSTKFDLGRSFMHAAAINGFTKLASEALSKESVAALDDNMYTPLHLAAENGWADFVQLMLQNAAPVNVKTASGSTPLHLAASKGFPSAVKALISTNEIDVNAEDNDGTSPLHQSVLNGIESVLQILLLDSRTDVNSQSKGNFTPLHLSAMVNAPEMTTKLLVAPKTIINAKCDGNLTALHLAAITGNVPAVQRLSGTNLNPMSVNGWTPLHYAVSLQNTNAASELLKKGDVIVNVLSAGQVTPLHIAAAIDQGQMIEELIHHGGSTELQTDEGLTALHVAAVNNNIDAMKVLLNKGANINARTPNGSTILHLAALRSDLLTTKYILDGTQAEVAPRNNILETPLDLAQGQGRADIVEVIKAKMVVVGTKLTAAAQAGNLTLTIAAIKLGASLEYKGANGRTALHLAAANGHLDVVQYLVAKGASLDAMDKTSFTAVHLAVNANKIDIVKCLVEAGAAVNTKENGSGNSPLHQAAASGFLPIATYLVDKGAKVNARNEANQTPLALATAGGKTAVVNYLKTKGGV